MKGLVDMRHIICEKVKNLRDLGGYQTKYGETKFNKVFRSSVPYSLTKDELKYFDNLNLTVIDLRTEEEVLKKKSVFDNNKYNYFNVVLKGANIPKKEKDIAPGYIEILDDYKQIRKVLEIIKNSKGSILYNCTSGKDRTGVITMLLMLIAGVTEDDIIVDYSISYIYLREDIRKMHKENSNLPKFIGNSKLEYMEETLRLFKEKYTNIDNYMKVLGFTKDEVSEIRNKIF